MLLKKIGDLNRIALICRKDDVSYYYDFQNDCFYYCIERDNKSVTGGIVALFSLVATALLRYIDPTWISFVEKNIFVIWMVPILVILIGVLTWYYTLYKYINPDLIKKRTVMLYVYDMEALVVGCYSGLKFAIKIIVCSIVAILVFLCIFSINHSIIWCVVSIATAFGLGLLLAASHPVLRYRFYKAHTSDNETKDSE